MKTKHKPYLDFIPLIILLVCTIDLLRTISTSNILLRWEHYIGFVFLLLVSILFWIRHVYGVLFTGLTLLTGFAGLLSFSPFIVTSTFGFGSGDIVFNSFRFQPIFIIWLIIHFIVSGRYYVGILTKKYWNELTQKTAAIN
jgi:hypothetical protein